MKVANFEGTKLSKETRNLDYLITCGADRHPFRAEGVETKQQRGTPRVRSLKGTVYCLYVFPCLISTERRVHDHTASSMNHWVTSTRESVRQKKSSPGQSEQNSVSQLIPQKHTIDSVQSLGFLSDHICGVAGSSRQSYGEAQAGQSTSYSYYLCVVRRTDANLVDASKYATSKVRRVRLLSIFPSSSSFRFG